jgi:hypothetical protein
MIEMRSDDKGEGDPNTSTQKVPTAEAAPVAASWGGFNVGCSRPFLIGIWDRGSLHAGTTRRSSHMPPATCNIIPLSPFTNWPLAVVHVQY